MTLSFFQDHINEVLEKLSHGGIDDEIWGKIVVMERCRRVAKAYLRKTTIIVDGGYEEFDGRTIGFNYFGNPYRDDVVAEMRSKIADVYFSASEYWSTFVFQGVIIKMDYQGNIKAMARGSSPVFVQGWKESKYNCLADRIVRQQGRLTTLTPSQTSNVRDEDRVVKVGWLLA